MGKPLKVILCYNQILLTVMTQEQDFHLCCLCYWWYIMKYYADLSIELLRAYFERLCNEWWPIISEAGKIRWICVGTDKNLCLDAADIAVRCFGVTMLTLDNLHQTATVMIHSSKL